MLNQCDECGKWFAETQEHRGTLCRECVEAELMRKGKDHIEDNCE